MISKSTSKHQPALLPKFVFTAVVVLLCLLKGNSVQAAIDEAMPSTIPAEILADWKDQGGTAAEIKASLPAEYQSKCDGTFESACHWRRVSRMKDYPELESIMFCRHHNFGGILVGYHDNSDKGNSDQAWSSNSALCVLNMKNYYSSFTEILKKTDGVVRDPCISFDGKKVLVAISGNGKGTGYKIYEMEIDNPGSLKQLTSNPDGMVVADFEPCYLPNGDIMFTSTRNFGLTDCAFNPTTNMFLMSGEGKYIRQVGFDQVHTFYPVLGNDGRVIYTRWEYNDRDITNTMGLFVMNPDGAHQTEFFGNQTSWPFTILQARPIPNSTSKVIAVAGGHHGPYAGELMIIDNDKGYNGPQSVQMIAPKRATKPDAQKGDVSMGGVYFTFQNPYPLDDEHFLVSWRKSESVNTYKLYFMDVDGNRELLAWASQSVSQPVLIQPREKPFPIAPQADYNDSMGTYTMQDVYYGEGMKGIEKGSAKTLRVVRLHYRISGSGSGYGSVMGSAPSGLFAPAIFVPVSVWGASWESKEVLGEAKIYEDGSAAFKVPARAPVYFQVLDSMGYCIAHMRSWSTLMPGEVFSCVGCHENKNEAPPTKGNPMAGVGEPQKLDTPLGIENKAFDFGKMVAPILQEKCASCHGANHKSGFDMRSVAGSGGGRSWTQSYVSLMKGIGNKSSNKAVNICYIFTQSEQLPPRSFGACLSGMMKNIESGHKDVKLTDKEKKIIACWIDLAAPHGGTYSDYLSNASGYKKLEEKRTKWAAIEAEGLKVLAQQTAIAHDANGGVNSARSFIQQLDIGYIPAQRALILKKASQGNFMLVDLRGRIISRMKLSDAHTDGNVTISLPASLSTGLYLARFEGVTGTRKAKINITQ